MKTFQWQKDGYTCSTDKSKLDIDIIHDFLIKDAYWAKGRTKEQVKRSINHSLSFGIYKAQRQVAFARVVSDFTIYAYILDVFVLEDERGFGLGKFLMESMLSHAELLGVKRWMLGTEDAHGLYQQYGFSPLKKVDNHLERVK